MFTIIVCSIHPADAERLRANIEKTIGVPFEFLVYDNRETGKGICHNFRFYFPAISEPPVLMCLEV